MLMSFFVIFNTVNAVDEQIISPYKINNFYNNENCYAYTTTKSAICSDTAVYVYDNTGTLVYTFYPRNYTSAGSIFVSNMLTSIVNYNSTCIAVASVLVDDNATYGAVRISAYFLNLDTFTTTILTENYDTKNQATMNYLPTFTLINYNSKIFGIFTAQRTNRLCTIVQLSPSVSVGSTLLAGTGDYYIMNKGIYIKSSLADTIYWIGYKTSTTMEIWKINLATTTFTQVGTPISVFNVPDLSINNFQIALLGYSYATVYSGNYTVNLYWTMKNTTFSAGALLSLTFDDTSVKLSVSTSIQSSYVSSPLRMIAKSPDVTSILAGTFNIYCIDNNKIFRFFSVTMNGTYIDFAEGYRNYGVDALPDNDGYEVFTYVGVENSLFTTSNIGGFSDLSNGNSNQLLFVIDFTSKQFYCKNEMITVSGSGLFTEVKSGTNDVYGNPVIWTFTPVLLENDGTGYYIFIDYTRNGLLDNPPLAQPYYTLNCSAVFNGVYENFDGYCSIYVTAISSTPYTEADIITLINGETTNNFDFTNGNYLFSLNTNTPPDNPDYYYQLIVLVTSYKVSSSPDVYQTIITHIFVIAHKDTITVLPDGLPDDYTPIPDQGGVIPTATPTGSSTNVVIPTQYWVVILIYLIFTIGLTLYAGIAGLFIGLMLATIICLITGLIPLWTIVVVVLGLIAVIVLYNKDSGSTP
jgi:hypothetical protein